MPHSIIILIIALISFYFLYARVRLYEKPWRFFNFCVTTIFLLIELICFAFINLKNLIIGVPEVLRTELIISTILFSVAFLLFISFNYVIKAFSRDVSLSYSYVSFWFLIFSVFIVLIICYWNNIVILLFDLILFTVFSLLNLKFGTYINKIGESTFLIATRIYFYALLLEILFLFYGIFNLVFNFNYIIAIFLSLFIIGVIFNLLSSYEKFISRKLKLILNP